MATNPAPDRRRILIIEDYRDGAITLQLLLELLGYDVRCAYSGTEGVRIASEWFPDIVLCDIRLPGLDGYGVARLLRRNPDTADACLIALSASGDDGQASTAGFDYHFTKPGDPIAMLALLPQSRADILLSESLA